MFFIIGIILLVILGICATSIEWLYENSWIIGIGGFILFVVLFIVAMVYKYKNKK